MPIDDSGLVRHQNIKGPLLCLRCRDKAQGSIPVEDIAAGEIYIHLVAASQAWARLNLHEQKQERARLLETAKVYR